MVLEFGLCPGAGLGAVGWELGVETAGAGAADLGTQLTQLCTLGSFCRESFFPNPLAQGPPF